MEQFEGVEEFPAIYPDHEPKSEDVESQGGKE